MLALVRIWILLSTLLVSAGWILSVLHCLNRPGYAVVFMLAGLAIILWPHKERYFGHSSHTWHKLRRRFIHPAPFLFLVLAISSLIAGILYSSGNYDSHAYRIPRVLHWLGAERWHWIHTFDLRMNVAGSGFEWLSAPLILFTRDDHWLFLINWLSYLLLPGLIFSILIQLKVSSRVAWWWTWWLSASWCFVFQASSNVNDSFAAVYALAAVDLALRAKKNNRVTDLWLSILAAALLTGAKQTNIPLVLLWFIAVWPARRLMFSHPFGTCATVIIGLLVSVVPITIFNLEHVGTWSGIPHQTTVEISSLKNMELHSPFWGIIGNTFSLTIQNLKPPFFPWAPAWNAAMEKFLQTPFGAHFSSFENFGYLNFGVAEATAGLGLGICALIFVSVISARWYRDKTSSTSLPRINQDKTLHWLRFVPWMLLLLYMATVGTYQNARQLTPYYVFLFPLLLRSSGHVRLARKHWWQWMGLSTMLFISLLLIVSRERPLFPAQTIISALETKYPHSKFVARIKFSYFSRSRVEGSKDWFKKDLPSSVKIVGYATSIGANEPPLWFPFGSRRVERIINEPSQELEMRDIHYVVVDTLYLWKSHQTIEQWIQQYNGELLCQFQIATGYGREIEYLYLVHLNPIKSP